MDLTTVKGRQLFFIIVACSLYRYFAGYYIYSEVKDNQKYIISDLHILTISHLQMANDFTGQIDFYMYSMPFGINVNLNKLLKIMLQAVHFAASELT